MGDPVQSLSKTVHPEVAGPKLQQNPMTSAMVVVTIWMAMGAYTLSELGRTHVIPGMTNRWSRKIVSCACLFYMVHVAAAFQVHHGWSHAAAYAHTATRAEATVGLPWGGGIYANYAFTALWLAEIAWWWVALNSYDTRPLGVDLTVRVIFLFMIVNGAVVFVPGAMRWVGAALAATLVVAYMRVLRSRPARRTHSSVT